MHQFTRREWLTCVTATALPLVANGGQNLRKIPFGFSLYGMKTLALPEAIKTCAECGYDGVELALMPGYHADPTKLPPAARKDVRNRLRDNGLSLLGLMENLPALGDEAAHKSNLERLKRAAELANLADIVPPIETILGGKPAEWEKVKDQLAKRVADWEKIARESRTVIAVKPHVRNAMHTPDGAEWLLKQIDSPWIRLAFDYSHFQLRGYKLADVMNRLVPLSAFIHVKDATGTADKFEFLLPGDGTTDYAAYAKQLGELKYNGPVVVEVSGMVSGKKDYDPKVAARSCYRSLAAAFGNATKKP